MTSLQVKSLNFNNKLSINFEGGNLSSDSGLLAYRSFDEKIGFNKLVKESYEKDEVVESLLTYKRADVILQNVYNLLQSVLFGTMIQSDFFFLRMLNESVSGKTIFTIFLQT